MEKIEAFLAEGRRLADAVTDAKSVGERTMAGARRLLWLRDNGHRLEELVLIQSEALGVVRAQDRVRGYPTGGEWQKLVAAVTAVEERWLTP